MLLGIKIEGKYSKIESNLCDYCENEEESLLHLFCECDIAASIWDEVIDWHNKFGYNFTYLSDSQILLGDPKFDPILNRILLTTKVIIFKNKSKKKKVTLSHIKAKLLYQFHTEHFIARALGRLKSFRGLWSPIWHEMKELSKSQVMED